MLALFNVESWLESGGLLILAAIVFAESGLLIGFFLPGDALLFIAGFLTSAAGPIALNVKPDSLPSLPVVAIVVTIAAIVGDQVGFLFGRKVGPSLFQREQSRFFKPAHVQKAHVFLETHGPKTIVLARFVPIVRTFAPSVAELDEAIEIIAAAQAAHWAPIRHRQQGQDRLHDRASYRYFWQVITRARRTGQPLPTEVALAFFGPAA